MSLSFIARETALNVGAELSEPVTIAFAGGGSVTFRATQETLSELASIGEIIEMDGVAALLQCATSDVAAVQRGDVATLSNGTTYRVVGIELRRAGRTRLVLGL